MISSPSRNHVSNIMNRIFSKFKTKLQNFIQSLMIYLRNPITSHLMVYILVYGIYLCLLFFWVVFYNSKVEGVNTLRQKGNNDENHHITQHVFSGMLTGWLTFGYSFCRWIYLIFGMVSVTQGLHRIADIIGLDNGLKSSHCDKDEAIALNDTNSSSYSINIQRVRNQISRYSYGYQRLEVIIRFSISILICFLCLALCAESTHTLLHFHYIELHSVFKITFLGITLDLIGTYVFRKFLLKSGASSWWWSNQTIHTTLPSSTYDSKSFSSYSNNHVWTTSTTNTQWFLNGQTRDIARSLLMNSVPQLLLLFTYEFLSTNFSTTWDVTLTFLSSAIIVAFQAPELHRAAMILLQTTPKHMQHALSKCLRELSMIDGVLEYHSDHFWTLGYGMQSSVGTITVRVREDADEIEISRACRDIFSTLVNLINIQIEKDSFSSGFGSAGLVEIPLHL